MESELQRPCSTTGCRLPQRKRKLAEPPPPPSSCLQAAGEPAPLPSVSEYLKWELLSPALRLTRARLKHVHPELRPELMKELERRKSQLQHIKLSKRACLVLLA